MSFLNSVSVLLGGFILGVAVSARVVLSRQFYAEAEDRDGHRWSLRWRRDD